MPEYSFENFLSAGAGVLSPTIWAYATLGVALGCAALIVWIQNLRAPLSSQLTLVLLPSFVGSLFTTFQYSYLFWILARAEWTSPIKIEVFLIWSMGAAIWGTISSVCLIGFLLAVKLMSRWFGQPGAMKNRLLGR